MRYQLKPINYDITKNPINTYKLSTKVEDYSIPRRTLVARISGIRSGNTLWI